MIQNLQLFSKINQANVLFMLSSLKDNNDIMNTEKKQVMISKNGGWERSH